MFEAEVIQDLKLNDEIILKIFPDFQKLVLVKIDDLC